ncbi:hypothetical protein NHX12_033077 [Muraenolepis orangiensis]|uniref:5-hydroxytryptamine receptor 3A n=1 Tax=Muraenolepis orangiensis TaxID=630683 RepID=A0A9Q0E310_9TELE|nr:hypothetical protein NHX12_033077 [Muraenolepis orangiensis]
MLLLLSYSMEENTAPFVPYVLVHSDGTIQDFSPVRVVSSCNLNIYTFPFDIQNCMFTFNSYVHTNKDVRMRLNIPANAMLKNSLRAMRTIQLRRSPVLYVVNLLIPSCFLITVDLFSFMLPPQSVDRSAFKMTLILGYTVFLLLMNDILPVTGNTTPLINVFFSICLALMVASLLETIFITNLHSGSSHFAPVPHWVKVVVLHTLGRLVGAVDLENPNLDELRKLGRDLRAIRLQVDQQLTGNQNSEEWIQRAGKLYSPPKTSTHRKVWSSLSNRSGLGVALEGNHVAKNSAPFVPYVHVHSDGMIENYSPVRVVSSCNLNIYTFPFDIQNCTFTFNSYIHSTKDIRVHLKYPIENILRKSKRVMSTVGEWQLIDITATKDFCFLIAVDLFSFMLPPQSVDRSAFKMTLILGYTVFLLLMNDILPVTGNTIPLINVFFSICLALMVASLLETIVITNFHSGSSHFAPVPHWVKVVVLQTLGCLVGAVDLEDPTLDELRKLGRDLRAIRLQVDQQLTGNQNSEEWIQIQLRRSPVLYVVNLLLPSCFLITVDLFSFMLPPQNVSLHRLALMVASLLETIFITNLHSGSSHFAPVPHWVKVVVLHTLGRLVGAVDLENPNLDELRKLGRDLQAIRLQVDQQLTGNQNSEEVQRAGKLYSPPKTSTHRKVWSSLSNRSGLGVALEGNHVAKNSAPFVPYVHVHSDGMIENNSPVRVVSSCNLNIYTFPFDIQNCTFTFNSYIHSTKDIRVHLKYPIEKILRRSKRVMSTVGEWQLIDITATKDFCFLIAVDLFSFMLPPQSVDRSAFKMTLILGYTVFLLLMNDILPVTGNTIPLINVFFSICLALMVASLLETIVITNFHSGSSHFAPVPHWVKVVVLQTLGCLVGAVDLEDPTLDELRKLGRDLRAIRLQVDQQLTGNQNSEEWIQQLKSAHDPVIEELRKLSQDLRSIRLHVDRHFRGTQNPQECCFLITVDLFSFMLPPQSVDRSAFKMTLILGYTVFLLLMNDLLPVTGNTTPLINVFFSISLALMVPLKSAHDPVMEELRKLRQDLRSIRLHVDRHFRGTQSTEEWHMIGMVIDRLLIIIYVIFICSVCQSKLVCKEGHSGPTTDSLQEVFDLKAFRPAVNLSNPTITNISFTLYAVLGVYWQHEFLVWDPEECDGVTRISVPVKELWSPDIIIYEFVDDDVSQACPYVYLNHTGHIRWDRMLRLVTACNLEIFSFPFDVQNCTFTFGSYMHTIRDVRVSPALTFEEISGNSKRYLEASGEWELVLILGETSILQFGIDKWDIIRFWVVIKRRPGLYVVNLLIPSSFLMLIDLLSFYLPPHSVDRASFKMTLILGYTVFLLIMNDLLPSTANGTPIIGIYFSVCLALMVISLLETVIITNVLHNNSMKYRQVPHWVRVVVLKHIANLICYRWPEEALAAVQRSHDKSDKSENDAGACVVQSGQQPPDQQPIGSGTEGAGSSVVVGVPELRQICQDVGELRAHLTALQKEGELQDQWCHVGYVLDFLLFRVYLLLISCYALVIVYMWCIWISET